MENETEILREEVIKYVTNADLKSLQKLQEIIADSVPEDDEFWDKLPQSVKDEMDVAIQELDAGGGIPHDEVVKKYPRLCLK